MYLRSRSRLAPPSPAPYVTSMSVLVGNEKGNVSEGSRRSVDVEVGFTASKFVLYDRMDVGVKGR